MKSPHWRELDDSALEKLLIDRWIFRGALLVLMMAAGVLATYVGMQGLQTVADRLTIGALISLTLSAGAAAFVMRSRDLRIHRELRRRRRS